MSQRRLSGERRQLRVTMTGPAAFEIDAGSAGLRFAGVPWDQCQVDDQVAAAAVYFTREILLLASTLDSSTTLEQVRSELAALVAEARSVGVPAKLVDLQVF